MEMEGIGVERARRRKGAYSCSKCGQPKKGHVCPNARSSIGAVKCEEDSQTTVLMGEKKEEEDEDEVRLANVSVEEWSVEAAVVRGAGPSTSDGKGGHYLALTETELGAYLGPFLHHALMRRGHSKQPKLPVRVRVPIWPAISDILHLRYASRLNLLEQQDEVTQFLGTHVRKTFPQGSYATIGAPLCVRFNVKKHVVLIDMHYAVFNLHDNAPHLVSSTIIG